MDETPTYIRLGERPQVRRDWLLHGVAFCVFAAVVGLWSVSHYTLLSTHHVELPAHAERALLKCRLLHVKPEPPTAFLDRTQSDRFVDGTRATLLRNASVWTGNPSQYNIHEVDILLDKGIIKFVGDASEENLEVYGDFVTVDVGGSWVTPGIIDMHTHLGVASVPELERAIDTNSRKVPIAPWLRSLDGLNTHDDAYRLAISGGVSTAFVLPGSTNAIAGQAFVIKLRPTEERSTSSMLLEPPYTINGTRVDPTLPPRWRQMKQTCGENLRNAYDYGRMDTNWAFREAYDAARKIKETQDVYCSKALAGKWDGLGDFPEDLHWEALVDVLRGRVKVHTHCYEAVDLDNFVRLTNEFEFPVAAFHHASETYLVPGLLKQAYNNTPAVALFATSGRVKRESYRASEFAPRILAENGIDVVMKSDHPVINSRYVLFEAQQAHHYGLSANLALSSVTSTPAKILGLDHRIGFIREGYDADLVIWDSHPLVLGVTPRQVWIDGIPQIEHPHVSEKPVSLQSSPTHPNFDKEAKAAIEYDGLPPLTPSRSSADTIVFTNVSSVYERSWPSIREVFSPRDGEAGVVVVKNGEITCFGSQKTCLSEPISALESDPEFFDLFGGSISPGLICYGSRLGVVEIKHEKSTQDGEVFDPLTSKIPGILAGNETMVALDGLHFAGRDTLLAYRAGVTSAITAPRSKGFIAGLSTAFSTGAAHALQEGAVLQEVVALHVQIGYASARSPHGSTPSVGSQVVALRKLLLNPPSGSPFDRVAKGEIPLVVGVRNADIIASLIRLKKHVEATRNVHLKLTLDGAAEAHILAKELSEANVGVIVTPSRSFPSTWEGRRILPGPPLTRDTTITTLLAHGVKVGIGIHGSWAARNIRLDAAWAALESDNRISRSEAIALASTNLEELLGIEPTTSSSGDLVVTLGGSILDLEAQVVAIISPRKHSVEWF